MTVLVKAYTPSGRLVRTSVDMSALDNGGTCLDSQTTSRGSAQLSWATASSKVYEVYIIDPAGALSTFTSADLYVDPNAEIPGVLYSLPKSGTLPAVVNFADLMKEIAAFARWSVPERIGVSRLVRAASRLKHNYPPNSLDVARLMRWLIGPLDLYGIPQSVL